MHGKAHKDRASIQGTMGGDVGHNRVGRAGPAKRAAGRIIRYFINGAFLGEWGLSGWGCGNGDQLGPRRGKWLSDLHVVDHLGQDAFHTVGG